jgi:hypothetical protein
MANRRLSNEESQKLFRPLMRRIRNRLLKLSSGDPALLWALRRKLAKELTYDERGTPMFRRKLKTLKRIEQKGRCAKCPRRLPDRGAVLDRIEAMLGYTSENTQLLCRRCDDEIQLERKFA